MSARRRSWAVAMRGRHGHEHPEYSDPRHVPVDTRPPREHPTVADAPAAGRDVDASAKPEPPAADTVAP